MATIRNYKEWIDGWKAKAVRLRIERHLYRGTGRGDDAEKTLVAVERILLAATGQTY